MLRLVMGQLGLSLDDENPSLWAGRISLKPLYISRSLLLIRDVYSTKVSFGDLVDWCTRLFLPVLLVLPPDTIESDNEWHR